MTDLLPVPAVSAPAPAVTADARPVHSAADFTLTPAARAALLDAMPASTRRAYERDWDRFAAWCAKNGRVAIPATPETVTSHVTDLTTTPSDTGRPLSPSSIERALAAIRTMHKLADVTAPETKAARKILDAYRERLALAKDPAARTRKADPATPDVLRAMLGTLNRDTLAGKRDAVILLLGYACATRVSELAALDLADVRITSDGLLVTAYRRKIKKFTEVAVPYGRVPATCPVRAVRDLVAAMAEAGRTAGPLLVRIDRHGRIAPPMTRGGRTIGDPQGRMTADAVADVVTKSAAAVVTKSANGVESKGLEGSWTGHSLRRGFATAARRSGAALEKIGRHGGWKDGSTALLGYIEESDRWTDNPVTGL
ncbi:tyrosine-type recombinase/integrase [Streptosporangium sandarakinum]